MRFLALVILFFALRGCELSQRDLPSKDANSLKPTVLDRSFKVDGDGKCYAQAFGSADIQIISETIISKPEVRGENGEVISPAIYKHVTRPKQTLQQNGPIFEAICPPFYTKEFISTVQRALSVRGYFQGVITGAYDAQTQAAIQKYQRINGINSSVIAFQTAETFGAIPSRLVQP